MEGLESVELLGITDNAAYSFLEVVLVVYEGADSLVRDKLRHDAGAVA